MYEKLFLVYLMVVLINASHGERRNYVDTDEEIAAPLFDVKTDETTNAVAVSDGLIESGWSQVFSTGGGTRWTTLNFAFQISCYQGIDGNILKQGLWAYERYVGYGCYCGGGNYHGKYLDATDLCCKYHDECYARAEKKYHLKLGCHTYTTLYKVDCCKDQKITKCQDSGPSAGRALCECDQEMAKCVAQKKAVETHNKALMHDRSQCSKSTGTVTKVLGLWDIIKSCQYAFSPTVKFPHTHGSQGTCPKKKYTGKTKSKGWFFKK